MHQRTQKTSVSELLVDRQQEADNGLYSCVHLDNQETDIDEVTRVLNGRQARSLGSVDRQDFICFYFKCHPSACWNYVGQETESVMTLWKVTLVRWPPITTRPKISAWPLLL